MSLFKTNLSEKQYSKIRTHEKEGQALSAVMALDMVYCDRLEKNALLMISPELFREMGYAARDCRTNLCSQTMITSGKKWP